MSSSEEPRPRNALFEAARLKAVQEETAQADLSSSMRRLTQEEREANRAANRVRNLRAEGLRRLKEGQPCTPTQAPHVGEYVRDYEERIESLRKEIHALKIELSQEQDLRDRWVGEWNAMNQVLVEMGIQLYEGSHGHGWEALHQDREEHEGYKSLADAFRAALLWWRSKG